MAHVAATADASTGTVVLAQAPDEEHYRTSCSPLFHAESAILYTP